MSGHTPGPWAVAPRIGRYQVIPATEQERYQLASINALEFEALSVGTPSGQMAMIPLDESNRANANLIAAAPDLLEALEDFVKAMSQPIPIINTAKAKSAIARAKGEA